MVLTRLVQDIWERNGVYKYIIVVIVVNSKVNIDFIWVNIIIPFMRCLF